jgi:hypothetical protein
MRHPSDGSGEAVRTGLFFAFVWTGLQTRPVRAEPGPWGLFSERMAFRLKYCPTNGVVKEIDSFLFHRMPFAVTLVAADADL